MTRAARIGLIGLATLLLAGCNTDVSTGFLPTGVTNMTDRITNLWNGSWVAALGVGVVVWGLILWCVIVYRKRKDDDVMPVQLRYHVPLEIMYTVVPIIMVGTLFYFTVRDSAAIEDRTETPDVTIEVIGKQWSWDFNYLDSNVHTAGIQADTSTGALGQQEHLPTLYLPLDQRVELVLNSRDVIHSFWVPQFLYKKDIIPGHENRFQIIPEVEGTYIGKCAELCGEFHGDMLFQVKVVDQQEYDDYIESLVAAGNTGLLDNSLNRLQHPTSGEDD